MKLELEKLILKALDKLLINGEIQKSPASIKIEHTKDLKHGDYASNIALVLSKQSESSPKELATKIIANIENANIIKKIEIAGPGFINFFLSQNSANSIIKDILLAKEKYAHSDIGKGKKVLLEFVSANPTGPLHVGHGRGAAYGATIANLMRVIGFTVENEYYVNDAGRQMDILALSILFRYIAINDKNIELPKNCYQGEYIKDLAKQIYKKDSNLWTLDSKELFQGISKDEDQSDNKEKRLDELIINAKKITKDDFQTFFNAGLNSILLGIKKDLEDFGVNYHKWFSELSITKNNLINSIIKKLEKSTNAYKKDGALWLKTSAYGDEKDRVILRDNGVNTYFAADIAYHADKFERGYDKIINIWGADHHGYINRINASINILGNDEKKLTILLVQFAHLYRNKIKLPMSTRSGSFISLKELINEVGKDAARFFYILRKPDQHMDFDIDLAKSKTNENPVFYIQYAHARICSVIKQAKEQNIGINIDADLTLLTAAEEKLIIKKLNKYRSVIELSALQYEPHQLAYYLRDLASVFHKYYNSLTFIVKEDLALTEARIALIAASKQILANGLELLGVSSPEHM